MSRSHGFLEQAVEEIKIRPGQSANEIVNRLLQGGMATSSAQNPVGSLVATLHKHYESKGIWREWQEGQYRFYPQPVKVPSDERASRSSESDADWKLSEDPLSI